MAHKSVWGSPVYESKLLTPNEAHLMGYDIALEISNKIDEQLSAFAPFRSPRFMGKEVTIHFGGHKVDFENCSFGPSEPMSYIPHAVHTARNQTDNAIESERARTNAALRSAANQKEKDDQRIKTLETALKTVQRLTSDSIIQQTAKLALDSRPQ
jgi:hypothetical protein